VTDYTAEYNKLVTFIKTYNIKKVIYYVPYSANPSFFNPAGGGLVGLLQSNPIPSSCKVQFLFDKSAFLYTSPNTYQTPTMYNTTNNTGNNDITGAYVLNFLNLQNKLNWVLDMQRELASSSPTEGIIIDPEQLGFPDPAPAGLIATTYQKIANYVDSYLIANGKFGSLTNNMTFGVNSVTPTLANRSLLPLLSSTNLGATVEAASITSFPIDQLPPWRTSQSTPILDNVHIQVYEPDMPYIFSNSLNGFGNNGTLAATQMLNLLTRTPYLQGEGTVNVTHSSSGITGVGMDFNNALHIGTNHGYITGAILQSAPIGVIVGGTQTCITPEDSSLGPPQLTCASKIDSWTTNTLTMTSPATMQSVSSAPWLTVEVIADWRNFAITQDMANGIVFTFSAESVQPDTFFGSWTLSQFVSFAQSFQSQGSSFGLFDGANLGPHIGLYSYGFINGSGDNPPQNIWFPGQ